MTTIKIINLNKVEEIHKEVETHSEETIEETVVEIEEIVEVDLIIGEDHLEEDKTEEVDFKKINSEEINYYDLLNLNKMIIQYPILISNIIQYPISNVQENNGNIEVLSDSEGIISGIHNYNNSNQNQNQIQIQNCKSTTNN